MQTIEHKRGSTFSYGGTVKLPAGEWTAKCSLKLPSWKKVADLQVTLTPLENPTPQGDTHAILLEAPASGQAGWPVGSTLSGDIVFLESGGIVIPSATFNVLVEQGITDVA